MIAELGSSAEYRELLSGGQEAHLQVPSRSSVVLPAKTGQPT